MAPQLSQWLANSNLSGHPSHGFQRVPEYVEHVLDKGWVAAARPEVTAETDTTVLIDGGTGFGHFAADMLTRKLAEKAESKLVAMGGIVRCTHIGRLGEWSELAADLGVLYFMCAGWSKDGPAAPFGGAEGRLVTNPLTFASPAAHGDRMMLDIATTASAEGKIRVFRDSGKPLPEGWILDKEGRPTTDANELYDGGVMLPFGGHKGYGLSVMVSILGGSFVGAAAEGAESSGVFAVAMNPAAFADAKGVLESVRANLERLRDTRPAEGFSEVLVPGDFERRNREKNRSRPIDLPDSTWRLFLEAAKRVGLDSDEIGRVAAVG
jgi:uncharacterized oxidoreductase